MAIGRRRNPKSDKSQPLRAGASSPADTNAAPSAGDAPRNDATRRDSAPLTDVEPRTDGPRTTEAAGPAGAAGTAGSSSIIELRDVTKVYPGGHLALERISLNIDRGEFVFLVGPTGCGKSSLIKLLIRELRPTEGQVTVAGRDIGRLPEKQIPYLRRNIGTVFQDFKLLPSRTVYDNVAYGLRVLGASRAEIRQKVPDILRLVGLSTKLHNYPDQLSGGEQQRVAVARAFVNHPPLLLADEPTGNLDPETSIGIMQLLYRINRTGTTVVVVTHDGEMVDKMRRRVIELYEGRVVRDQAGGGYRTESTTEFGARIRAEYGVGPEGQTNGQGHEVLQ